MLTRHPDSGFLCSDSCGTLSCSPRPCTKEKVLRHKLCLTQLLYGSEQICPLWGRVSAGQAELTRLYFHGRPVRVTLTLCIRHFQVKRVGPLHQVGEEEDRVMVRVVQHLLWAGTTWLCSGTHHSFLGVSYPLSYTALLVDRYSTTRHSS